MWINKKDGQLHQKYKGHENKVSMISAEFDDCTDCVLVASENGSVFVWNKFKDSSNASKVKNDCFESFYPSNRDEVRCSTFAVEKAVNFYNKKMFDLSNSLYVKSIIISGGKKGSLSVCINVQGL